MPWIITRYSGGAGPHHIAGQTIVFDDHGQALVEDARIIEQAALFPQAFLIEEVPKPMPAHPRRHAAHSTTHPAPSADDTDTDEVDTDEAAEEETDESSPGTHPPRATRHHGGRRTTPPDGD
jgi:hypothetical protein